MSHHAFFYPSQGSQNSLNAPIISGLVAIIVLLLTQLYQKNLERRKIYAEAYKAAMSWKEMLYRVRRRGDGAKEQRKIVERFHDLQEDINYFEGILAADSVYMGRSYKKLVDNIKRETKSLIKQAWNQPIRPPKVAAKPMDKDPNTSCAENIFIKDTRDWLNPWLVPKLFVIWRNNR